MAARMRSSLRLSATTRRGRYSSARASVSEGDHMKKAVVILSALATILVAAPRVRGQAKPELDAIQAAVSIAEIQKTLDAINIDRTSGRPGERQAAEYLGKKLTE